MNSIETKNINIAYGNVNIVEDLNLKENESIKKLSRDEIIDLFETMD